MKTYTISVNHKSSEIANGPGRFVNPIYVDLDLIRKYNQPGPRYTSYPTALQFSDEIDRDVLLADTEKETGPFSLYFHIPFCESLCWFCGCTTIITPHRNKADTYLDYLEKEVALFRSRIKPDRKVVQLHFGGGTPNFLEPSQLERLAQLIRENFEFDDEAELGVELDPRRLTKEHIQAFRNMGINRASIGVQDCNPDVQHAIHRIQPREVNEQAIQWLRAENFRSINIDLIYGLPLQTMESISATLDEVLEYDPDRLAIYSYAHVPWIKPAQKILEHTQLPDPELKIKLLQLIIEKLTAHGYVCIGMDHFAKINDDLALAQRKKSLQRNFQGYSTHADTEICAFGVSSISQTPRIYRQNFKTIDDYYKSLDHNNLPVERGCFLSSDDQMRRETIMRLMCDLSLDFDIMSRELDINFPHYFASELDSFREMEEDGLVYIGVKKMEVSDRGRLFIRNIAMHFDAYLGKTEKRYSRTI